MSDTEQRPKLSNFDLRGVRKPDDGLLYLIKRGDGFWWITADSDMALQEATGYPVGELVEYEQRMDDYESQEAGEMRVLIVGEDTTQSSPREQDKNCPTCGAGPSFAVPVWEDVGAAERGEAPDYVGCTECHTMRDVRRKTEREGLDE